MTSSRRGSAESHGDRAARAGSRAPELFTLGGVRLVRQGVDETSKLAPKHLALLVYLLHEQRPMHPSEVIELLGRGQDPQKEMEGLARAVTWLRENVPGVNIRMSGDTIESFGGVTLDTREVDAAIDGGDPRHVAELYVGEFLEGFESASPAFDDWAQKERGRLRRAWSHVMLAAAREAERRRKWDTAAEWWRVLVARAPIRPEAVAGLLGALAASGNKEEAAQAFAEYTERLEESGIAQPANLVKEVIAKYKVLRDIAGDIELSPEPAAAAEPTPAAPAPAPEPIQPEPPLPLDVEPPRETPAAAPPETGEPAMPAVESLSGSDAGAPPPVAEEVAAETTDELEAPEEAWEEIVDITSADEFDIDVTPAPPPVPPPAKPVDAESELVSLVDEVMEPEPEPEPEAAPTPKPREWPDEARRDVKPAAPAYGGTRYRPVRHEVTSVRKPWGPVVRKWWDELEPLRTWIAELAVATAQVLGAALVLGLQLSGRGLRALGLKTGASLTALGGRLKAARQRAVETRAARAQARSEQKVRKAAEREARQQARRAEKEARRAEKEEMKAALETATAEPEVVEAAVWEEQVEAAPREEEVEVTPWEEMAAEPPPAPQPARAAPVVIEPPLEEVEPPAEEIEPLVEDVAPVADYAAAAAEVPLIDVTPPRVKRKRRPIVLVRRYWYAPVALAVIGLAVVLGPRLAGLIGGLTEELPSRLPEVQAPNIPTVSLPVVTIRTPAFVETAVSRVSEMLSGPLLEESGRWLLLADVEIEGPDGASAAAAADGATAAALGQVFEADLIQAKFFNVVPHERALTASRRVAGLASETLPVQDALTLAGAAGYAAVISAGVTRHEAVDSVRIQVFNAAGDTLYGVAAEVAEESNTLETLAGLTRAVRRRLGEPGEAIERSLPPTQALSTSAAALDAYAQARLHFFAGRYYQAITAAGQATGRDSTFAQAHHLLAQAYALTGQRARARNALEAAWRFSERLTPREHLRLLGDRHAWDGRLEEAVLTYDALFSDHRDDAGALRSQALVQRMIGVRGGGEGNLRIAHAIDPYDWPPLSRLARYLGYAGTLPNVDSLVAAHQEQPQ